jgi:hypothetical protein
MSSSPHRRVNRRKMIAGMSTSCTVAFMLRKTKERLNANCKVLPVARAAETLLCRDLGIIQEGHEITKLALQELERRFENKIPDDVLAAVRAMFRVQSPKDDAIDDALLSHGGLLASSWKMRT